MGLRVSASPKRRGLPGVSPAAPYRHFRDRDALLAEVAKHGFERFAARLDMAWNNGVPTPLSAFDNLGKAYLAFARDEPASYAVMFESGVAPGAGGEPIPAAERAFDVLQHAAAALCRALPESERPPIRLMSLHIWAISHGVATLFAQGEARKVPMSPEEILESAMLIYLKGLGILPGAKVASSDHSVMPGRTPGSTNFDSKRHIKLDWPGQAWP